jgi:hypothetical protein
MRVGLFPMNRTCKSEADKKSNLAAFNMHFKEKDLSDKTGKNASRAVAAVRLDHEPPSVIAAEGWRYHHIGIPTRVPQPDEVHVPHLKIHVAGFESSPYGIQWMRYDADAPYPEIIKTVPHVAFEVDDLAAALEGKEILTPPNSPSEGVTVAMILDHGAPVELIWFSEKLKSSSKANSSATHPKLPES